MRKESDILLEIGDYWVTHEALNPKKPAYKVYKVWKTGFTHSTLAATCGYEGNRGMDWCKEFIKGKLAAC